MYILEFPDMEIVPNNTYPSFLICRLAGPKDTLGLPFPTQIFLQVSFVPYTILRVSPDVCFNLCFSFQPFVSSEGFVAGVGPAGASYAAELSLDQSKVRINQKFKCD